MAKWAREMMCRTAELTIFGQPEGSGTSEKASSGKGRPRDPVSLSGA